MNAGAWIGCLCSVLHSTYVDSPVPHGSRYGMTAMADGHPPHLPGTCMHGLQKGNVGNDWFPKRGRGAAARGCLFGDWTPRFGGAPILS